MKTAPAGKDIGAGDQGMMFGFACNDTPELMPLPIALAHRIINRITELRQDGTIPWLRPDAKSQVTIEYDGFTPVRVDTVVVSTQHASRASRTPRSSRRSRKQVIEPVLPAELVDGSLTYHINPTGKFVIGGPHGDSGVTGRKIIVDTYGGMGRHGGGAFSGKDPTKVDRSAAYMARYVAKNIVAAGLAERCEIQLAYAIGVSEPVSVHVDTQGTGTLPDSLIAELVRRHFRLNPSGIIKHLDLRRPIYRKTASGGHFGRSEPEFTWEKTDKAHLLREAANAFATVDDRPDRRCRHADSWSVWQLRRRPAFTAAVRRRAGRDGVCARAASSSWATTPTTTAAWSSPRRSIARRSSSAGDRRSRGQGRVGSTSARSTPSRSMRSSRRGREPGPATSAASAGPCPSGAGRSSSGFEAVDRRRRSAGGGPLELGEPSGVASPGS